MGACVVALAGVVAACADTDPTSSTPAGFVPIDAAAPATDPTATSLADTQETTAAPPDAVTPTLAATPTATPTPTATATPTATPTPTATAATPTATPTSRDTAAVPSTNETTDDEDDEDEDEGESVDAEASTADGLATDDPTFDVEPLRPFEVATAENAAPSSPGVDDTGVEEPTGWAAFDASLDDALLRNGNTAASVSVLIGGEPVHASAFGTRAPGVSDDRTMPGDRFRIASISKPITAITLLQLVEEGVVGLDDQIGQLVADQLGVSPSAGAQRLTIRRLLSHTSGFAKYDSQFFRKGASSCEDAARQGIQSGAGGGGYLYSNMNYCVAGILIEALTAKSYTAAAYEQVLTPLGLSGMRLANTFDPGPGEVLHQSVNDRNYMETLGAAGSWIATPTDLVTIMNSLDPTTPGFKPLDPLTVLLMETPTGAQFGQRGYGLGVISYGDGRFGHTGTIENTHAMVLNRGDGVTWAVTVAGPYPDDTPRLESIVNRAFEAAGFISG